VTMARQTATKDVEKAGRRIVAHKARPPTVRSADPSGKDTTGHGPGQSGAYGLGVPYKQKGSRV
jgi:hypothetical protein